MLVARVVACGVLAIAALGTPATASPLTFQFTTQVDATSIGGPPSEPLVITYSFDSAATGTTSGPSLTRYPLLAMTLQLDNQTVTLPIGTAADASVYVFNNAGTTPPLIDEYVVQLNYGLNGPVAFGQQLALAQINIIDPTASAFTDTSLPTDPSFSGLFSGNQSTFNFDSESGGLPSFVAPVGGVFSNAPFTLAIVPPSAAVPEPASLLLVAGAAAGLLVRRRSLPPQQTRSPGLAK